MISIAKHRIFQRILWMLIIFLLVPFKAKTQQKMVKILVCSPSIENRAYSPIADVMAGSIIREFNRAGGIDIIDREKSEHYLKERDLNEWVNTRELALEVGEALGVDIVIYSTIGKKYDSFIYSLSFLEVEKDVIQRTLHGSFPISSSPSEIGRIMKTEAEKMQRYVPLPSELVDPGLLIREKTVNPERLPVSAKIDGLPPIDRFGFIEQIFSYYRVFPGEQEYTKLENQTNITKFSFREELDDELTRELNQFYIYGDFAIRHNLQAYLVKDCSINAINVLLANKIPVFYIDGIIIGYSNLTLDGYCIYHTIDKQVTDVIDLTHRKRIAVMFIVPKLGQKFGVSKEYLEFAVGFYHDELGKNPTLVEIKESMFDIISSGLE